MKLSAYAEQLLAKVGERQFLRPLITGEKQTWDMGFAAYERGIPFRMLTHEAAQQGWRAAAKVDELAADPAVTEPTAWDSFLDRMVWIPKVKKARR